MRKILIAIFLGLVISSSSLAEGFIIESLPEAQKLAEKTNRPILVIFGAEYCTYCHKLKRDILLGGIPESDKYIVCYIDIEKDEEIKKKYRIKTIPESRIFDKDKEKGKIIGYMPKRYREWLKSIE
jgi:thioredoxin-related protein